MFGDKMQLKILPYALAVAQSQSMKLNRFELLFRIATEQPNSPCPPPPLGGNACQFENCKPASS